MIDLNLPTRPELATMVIHSRQLLLRDGSPEALHLYRYGTELTAATDALTELPSPTGEASRLDYTNPSTLDTLTKWLERHVRTQTTFNALLGRDPVFLHILALAKEQAVAGRELRSLR